MIFVVQKHMSSRLHYDFRLEIDGVLKSWAIPKGPSLDPKVKRLAILVEDHLLEYKDFEGAIPEGEYGAGAVLIWDQGTWTPQDDINIAIRKGNLKFRLYGKKLRGLWVLIKMKKKPTSDGREEWLLVKEKDAEAKPETVYKITEEMPDSVVSGRGIEEVA